MTSTEIGNLCKMKAVLEDTVQYFLTLKDDNELNLNKHIGSSITIKFLGKIQCVNCKKNIKKSYQQGYCFPCTQKLAACDMCILKPELCHYHLGTCREPEWGQAHCFRPHIVYLADTGNTKVGITRESQVPTRWLDQGATMALPIIKVQSRLQSGLIEKAIAKFVSDKTNWRKMLQYSGGSTDKIMQQRDSLFGEVQEELQQISGKFTLGDIEILTQEEVVTINYPVEEIPKIVSISLDKSPEVTGKLLGIKGQYLLLGCGVLNIRRHTGYEVEFLTA